MSTEAEQTAAAASEAFFVFLGITFGPLDLAILAVLAAGGIYYLLGRNKNNNAEAVDKFSKYSIQ